MGDGMGQGRNQSPFVGKQSELLPDMYGGKLRHRDYQEFSCLLPDLALREPSIGAPGSSLGLLSSLIHSISAPSLSLQLLQGPALPG